MDTGSHVLMGIGLSALATLDPEVSLQANNLHYIAAVTVTGSLIPDIDVLLKFFGNNVYINNHRGISHSFMFILFWSLLIPGIIFLFNRDISYYILWRWSLTAVSLHVFTDIFNGYGTQVLWPLYKKWVALGVTYTFDIFMIGIHLLGFLIILLTDWDPGLIFLTVYTLIGLYLVIQIFHKWHLKQVLVKKYGPLRRYVFVSKSLPHTWKYVVECQSEYFYIGLIHGLKVDEQDKIKKETRLEEWVWKLIKNDHNIKAFLNFSPIYNWKVETNEEGITEVRAFDLRYLSKNRKGETIYAFNALVHIKDRVITDSYMGFVYDEDLLQKHLKKKVSYKDYIHILKNAD